ncbi:MAG: protein kinase, partial [Polyangiaceae bacterium]
MTDIKDQTARIDNKSQAEGDQPKSDAAKRPQAEIGRDSVMGRYKVMERLGSNAAASVYSAYDSQLDRIVALKVLSSQPDAALRDRVLRDAQAMSRFQHPHVVAVHDAGTFGDRVYVAMEFI